MKTFFRIAAIFDWFSGLGLILNPYLLFEWLHLEPPNYRGLFVLLGCFVLVFGWVFWQVSRYPSNRQLFQIALLAKIAGFLGLSLPIFLHQLPPVVFWIGLVGDGIWIPPFVYFYRASKLKGLG